jgi:macrodomain Ter protein organizer (MatP/YcbG family)
VNSMARKKISLEEVVLNHYWFIKDYFDRAIKNQKILVYEDNAYDAKDEFNKLPLYANENKPEAVAPLSNWIEKYISAEKWGRCKTAIRQNALMQRQKYEYKTFRIPRSLSWDINNYAERVGLTKFAAMQKAIDIATKLLDANENKDKRK